MSPPKSARVPDQDQQGGRRDQPPGFPPLLPPRRDNNPGWQRSPARPLPSPKPPRREVSIPRAGRAPGRGWRARCAGAISWAAAAGSGSPGPGRCLPAGVKTLRVVVHPRPPLPQSLPDRDSTYPGCSSLPPARALAASSSPPTLS